MRTNKYSATSGPLTRAAMLIDYSSLFKAVETRTGKTCYPDEVILEMIAELRRHLQRDFGCEVGHCRAYADFSQLGDHAAHIQRELAHNGIETRFVPTTIQPNAPESVLSFETGKLLGRHADETTFVILSGQRVYHALANVLAQHARQVIVLPVGMDGEVSDRDVHPRVRYVSASLLLSDAMKKVSGTESIEGLDEGFESVLTGSDRSAVEHTIVTNPVCKRTLEIVQRYFGQYDEVYLTPLLRKLSEEFDEPESDPKTVINELEQSGAVWLEKRRGFPYDYTVLIIDTDHPDVQTLRAAMPVEAEKTTVDIDVADSYRETEPAYGDGGTSSVEMDTD